MDPEEVEFIGEKENVVIVPTFNYSAIHLISGDIGPFRAGLPVKVPLWIAINLKQQQICKIEQPDWMDIDYLENLKETEKNAPTFTKMPNEHYMTITKALLKNAPDDLIRANEIRTLVKDIWDIRMSKLRSSVDELIKNMSSYAAVDNLTMMEINSMRPLLPHALDQIHRMKRYQGPTTGSTSTSGQQSRSSYSFRS
ncbi:probable DNA replication complex GINS protein PSF2 [Coccinella septempunctata]|uniref:probable DNA replication complex GINS protein PSF2 n=1 Tax=Coccinella septempunctata TaxID=41139 RepID=UPI001D0912CA|nr:probable DNA replication complex GINS protein PSF2 [Coccinella septempunctata]